MRQAGMLAMMLMVPARDAHAQQSAAEIAEAERLFDEARTLLKARQQLRAGAVESIEIETRHHQREDERRTGTETAQPRSRLAPLATGVGAIVLAGAALWLWQRSADTYESEPRSSPTVRSTRSWSRRAC